MPALRLRLQRTLYWRFAHRPAIHFPTFLLFTALAGVQSDPLPSWNNGPANQAIDEFIQKTTDKSSPTFVPQEERIATFDQDGALWVEHPIYERIGRVLEHWQSCRRILPESSLGKAISYALGQWESLAIYLHNGTIEIDNNSVENAIRPTAIGKKNWLFFGDAQAGERSAILYTIIESCRRRGVEPSAYLIDVLTRLPTMTNQQISAVTPKAWAAAQKAAIPKAA